MDNQNYKNVFKNTQVSGVHSEGLVIESLPLSNIKTRQGLMLDGWCVVTSVLAPGSGIQSGNGAKQIDVIARYLSETPGENTNQQLLLGLFFLPCLEFST